MRRTERLRQLLAQGPVVAPGTYDAIIARAIQEAGFPAIYVSGSGLSCARGKPDIGWLSLSEVVHAVAGIADCVDIPVIADADTGYGGALSVRRTVREFERSGVAGLHIEDQVPSKRCAYFSGVELISNEEMAVKVRSAVDARTDADFLIIARTDALQVSGLEDAVTRAQAYLAAGADAIFVNALEDRDSIQAVRRALPNALLIFNFNSSSRKAVRDMHEPGEMGYGLTILPGSVRLAVLHTVRKMLAGLSASGSFDASLDRMESFEVFSRFMGIEQFQEMERRYLDDQAPA